MSSEKKIQALNLHTLTVGYTIIFKRLAPRMQSDHLKLNHITPSPKRGRLNGELR